MPPIFIAGDIRHLVPSELESRLLGSNAFTKGAGGWTPKAKGQGLFFDLSRVEWVDVGALAQVVLLTESALRAGLRVSVAFPLPYNRKSEEAWVRQSRLPRAAERVSYRVDRRKKALEFLRHLNFKKVLTAEHVANVSSHLTILDSYDPSVDTFDEETKELTLEAERNVQAENVVDPDVLYKYCFPLTWLSPAQVTESRDIAKFLAGVIGEPRRGLEAFDASAIANVILYELVENVPLHAGEGLQALVTAWARPEHLLLHPKNYIDCEVPYLEWLGEKGVSTVEILVGDSGRGVPSNLAAPFKKSSASAGAHSRGGPNATARVLQWAFDRWSSSKPPEATRGTRGLYRVDRVVKKYQGTVTIRAENQMAGWDHGGNAYDAPIHARQKLSYTPGTLLRLRMLSFHKRPSGPRLAARPPKEVTLKNINLGPVGPQGVAEQKLQKLRAALSEARTDKPLCVVAVVEGGAASRRAVEKALRQAAEVRHPGTLVLCGLPGGWTLIEAEVDSINAEYEVQRRGVESHRPKHFEIWDPVLVVGPQGQTQWAGVSQQPKKVLDALIESSDGKLSVERLASLLPDEKERNDSIRYLRNDTNLITIKDDGSLELLTTLSDVVGHTVNQLQQYLRRPAGAEGVLAKGTYRTPSLLLVSKWLDVETIVANTSGTELAMMALAARVKQSSTWREHSSAKMILADSTVSPVHLETLRKYLNVELKETIPGETGAPLSPGARVIPIESKVVVYCDVIAASEAVGRCLRQIRKDRAIPVAIVCLFDARKTPGKPVSMLDMDVPVIPLASISTVVDTEPPEGAINISPITRRVETERSERFEYVVSRQSLYRIIRKANALHFRHVGRPIGRHFTFYLDAMRLVGDPSIIKAFNLLIESTLKRLGDREEDSAGNLDGDFELWYPSPEPKPSEPARRFAEIIGGQRADVRLVKGVRRESAYGHWVFTDAGGTRLKSPTVVIIDWGALTGTTVAQTLRLAAEAGADRVLVLIFLSQLPKDEEGFLRSINTLEIFAGVTHTDTLPRLPFADVEEKRAEPDRATKRPKVSINFLATFPIEAYNPYECPVCQQLIRLSQEEYPTELLQDFATYQHETRLRLRTREAVLDAQPTDYDGRILSSRAALWMVYLRGTLEEALGSTEVRQAIRLKVEAISRNLKNKSATPTKALWLLHFLSIETQWLRRPPLYFRKLRRVIAEIALEVSLRGEVEEVDKLNAIIVLRTADKTLFATRFADIFVSAISSVRLMRQLLYDAFTYVNRPYHQSPRIFEPLRNALLIIQRGVNDRSIILTPPDSSLVSETVDRLLARTETELAKAGVRMDTPVQSWAKLRNDFSSENYHPHDPVPEGILWMQPGLDAEVIERQVEELERDASLPREVAPSVVPWLSSLKDYWDACCRFLDYNVLPRLSRLKPILLSKDARDSLGTDTVEHLVALIDMLSEFRAPVTESRFSELVRRTAEDPSYILSRANWDAYRRTASWYRERILKPSANDSPPSRLIQFLGSAPVSLGPMVRKVYGEVRGQLPRNHTLSGLDTIGDFKVFCTDKLLHDAVKELFINVEKHVAHKYAPVAIRVEARKAADRVSLTVSNTHSRLQEPAGRGLQRLNNRLRPFGAEIAPEPRPDDGQYTYKVDLNFLAGE